MKRKKKEDKHGEVTVDGNKSLNGEGGGVDGHMGSCEPYKCWSRGLLLIAFNKIAVCRPRKIAFLTLIFSTCF